MLYLIAKESLADEKNISVVCLDLSGSMNDSFSADDDSEDEEEEEDLDERAFEEVRKRYEARHPSVDDVLQIGRQGIPMPFSLCD